MNSNDLKEFIKNKYIIGVIGHRDLTNYDCHYKKENNKVTIQGHLKPIIEKKLKQLKDQGECVLLSPLAEGADQLVADVARELEIKVAVITPWEKDHYGNSLKNEDKRVFFTEFIKKEDEKKDEDKDKKKDKGLIVYELDKNKPKIDKNGKENNHAFYKKLSEFLLINCDAIIFLWDGVYTGNEGGTSSSYYKAINGFRFDRDKNYLVNKKNKKIDLFHLPVPRESNLYPIIKKHNSKDTQPFETYSQVYPYVWQYKRVLNPSQQLKRNLKDGKPKHAFFRNRIFWAYIIPFVLVTTMVISWILYMYSNGFNKFWQEMVTLIQFPTANIPDKFESQDFFKKLAASIGAILVPYSIGVTLIYALQNDRRIISLYVRSLFKRYDLILGLGWKGSELAFNLKKNKHKTVVLEKDNENPNIKSALRQGISVINGNFNDPYIFSKIRWHKAKDIYIVGKDDETNIRAIQLFDNMLKHKKRNKKHFDINLHAHIEDLRNKNFISEALQNQQDINLNCFNIYENIIRRLLLKYPLDRFYFNSIRKINNLPEADTLKVVILGFNLVSKVLLRYCFTHLIVDDGEQDDIKKTVEIEIYIDKDNPEVQKEIENIIPYVFRDKKTNNHEATNLKNIVKYVYGNYKLEIHQLPESQYDQLNQAYYLQDISTNKIISIFACIDDGLKSSAYISDILPALEAHKQKSRADIQVFCYFNFPEEKENTFIEESINNLASHVPVFFFGNFTEEFTEEAIKLQQLDQLAKLVNILYDHYNTDFRNSEGDVKTTAFDEVTYDKNIDEINRSWNGLEEFKKESNRLAADHIFFKLRTHGYYLEKIADNDNAKSGNINAQTAFWKEFVTNRKKMQWLCQFEHRRWCAERLFDGWQPMPPDWHRESSIKEKLDKWKKEKKPYWEPVKRHIDLDLPEIVAPKEKLKDKIIMENIDLMFLGLGYEMKKAGS